MTEQQNSKPWIPKLVAALVEHQSAFGGLSTENAQLVIQQTKPAIALFVAAMRKRAFEAKTRKRLPRILQRVEASPTTFSVNDTFFAEKSPIQHSFNINGNGNFRKFFAGMEERIEYVSLKEFYIPQPMPKSALEIIEDLGGEAAAEVGLYDLWKKILLGELHRGETVYIFFVKDKDNVLRFVHVYWLGNNWVIFAYPVNSTSSYCGVGAHVFSRE